MHPHAPNIAVLDDEAGFRQALNRLLKTYGFRVRLFEDAPDLLEGLKGEVFDCLLLDLHMPGTTGFDILRELESWPNRPPVIVITGHDEPGNPGRLRAFSVVDYLVKPVDETALLDSIERCLGPSLPRDLSGTKPIKN